MKNDETEDAGAGRPPSPSEASTAGSDPSFIEPQRIDRYRILQKIGEGGMGVVYEAEQEAPVRRRVALKLVKWGMDTKQVIARFEAERQALALMSHPNIATVFDAGATETGRPYFVMECIKGVPITEYCDHNRLTIRERLELFMQVCKGVQHAHERGIIHRDLKPSNVLIEIKDGVPTPKIIDFGVAKATEHRLTERTLFTERGQLVGTPEYMSPEQAEMSPLDVDTRTDVYSLGVVLYEMLAGTLPFDSRRLREAGFAQIQRIIVEEEPPTPSTRLASLGDSAADVSKRRQSDRRSLKRTLEGDLDWIVMRAIEKDRTHRYGSASDLASDLSRYLRDERVAPRMGRLVGRRWSGHVPLVLLVLSIPGIVGVLLTHWPPAERLETSGLTLLFTMRGARQPPSNVCIVALDDPSYNSLKQRPDERLPRTFHTDLVRTLKREGARTIAFDILFTGETDPAQDAAFARAVEEAGNVVLGSVVESVSPGGFHAIEPVAPLAAAAAALGDVGLPLDGHGLIRFTMPPSRSDRASFALAAYEVATGDRSLRADPRPRLVDYYGPPRTIRTVSLYEALDPGAYLPGGFFHDKIVLVGLSRDRSLWSGTAADERYLTPFMRGEDAMEPGVEIHATIVANMLEGRRLHVLPSLVEGLLLFLFPLGVTWLLVLVRPAIGILVLIASEIFVVAAGYAAFAWAAVWLPLVIPAVVQIPLATLGALVLTRVLGRPRR